MALVSYGRSFTLAATNDERPGLLRLTSLRLSGTSMTAGHRLTITDTAGDILADHYVVAANENVELLMHPRDCKGVKASAVPASGTFTVLGQFE